MSTQTTVSQRKLDIVEEITNDLNNHQTIGIIAMESIGAKTVQKLRAELRGRAKIKVAKNTLMKKALENAGKLQGADLLSEYISGPVAFLFTNDSPFSIANYLEKNKVPAPAKSGQIAPKAVVVPKMNTGFPPGTIISELNSVGLPTRIEQGTVAIPEDTKVLEPGDRISTTLAAILSQLDIEPFEVGLSLQLVLEGGEIIEHDGLLIDFDEYINDLIWAHQQAVNLSVNAGIFTTETAPLVISNAQQKVLALASSIGYVTPETASVVFGKAQANALALLRAVLAIDSSAVPGDVASMAAIQVASTQSAAPQAEQQEEEEELDEELEDAEEVDEGGLGSLFG